MRSKPTPPVQTAVAPSLPIDPLAGDPAAKFAMRSKPAAPVQTASVNPAPSGLPVDNPLELAETTVPLPEGQRAQPTESVVASAEQTVAAAPQAPPSPVLNAVDRPISDDPRNASIKGLDSNETSSRVLSAFQAAETANPFEALFRNDTGSADAGVNPRFASAFAAVEEAALFSALSGASNQVAAQELALANQGGPLDLTRFLRLKADDEQKDLLPPA